MCILSLRSYRPAITLAKPNIMLQHAEITDLAAYNSRMQRSMMDKLFFVDKIEPDCIVDFGCADGTLIRHLQPWLPKTKFFGYDVDPKMIEIASQTPFGVYTDNWDDIFEKCFKSHKNGEKIALVLSSIVHEIYHYLEPKDVDLFWQKVWNTGFDYIVMRDMVPARALDRPSSVGDVSKVYRAVADGKFVDHNQLADFENIYGSIERHRNLTHFLLKYKYREPNWAREVKENYFPFYREDLLAMIPAQYDVMYHEHYTLPYIRRTVLDELKINVTDPTHLKLILEIQ